MGVGRISGGVKDLDELRRTVDQISELDEPNKPYFETGVAAQSTVYRRNGFDANHAYGSYRALKSAPNNSQVASIHSNRTNWPVSKNWKTSEEEEYVWDEMGSRSADYEGARNKRNSLSTDDQDKLPGLQSREWMPMETDQVDSRLKKIDAVNPRSKTVGTEDRVHFPRVSFLAFFFKLPDILLGTGSCYALLGEFEALIVLSRNYTSDCIS